MSCFQPKRECTATVVAPKWLRYAVYFDNPFGNTKYCITQMAFSTTAGARGPKPACVSALKKRELVDMRMALSHAASHEDMARALRMPWPLPMCDVLGALEAALKQRADVVL